MAHFSERVVRKAYSVPAPSSSEERAFYGSRTSTLMKLGEPAMKELVAAF